ncbi:MAG: hypothetical protein M1833_002885 [Piccolia ochrophora]|nr:MAG: hypothetical protein M1833_002885 [Piccolia ochrophora]
MPESETFRGGAHLHQGMTHPIPLASWGPSPTNGILIAEQCIAFGLHGTGGPTQFGILNSARLMDPFSGLLDLEDNFYKEGYDAGHADGRAAGHLEGHQLGLEKGFENHLEIGRIYGRACIWAARMPSPSRTAGDASQHSMQMDTANSSSTPVSPAGLVAGDVGESVPTLPPLPDNSRLEKHIRTLLALVDPSTVSTENTEEAGANLEERLRRAKAKVKVIERMTGESGMHTGQNSTPGLNTSDSVAGGEENIEELSSTHVRT